MPEWKVTQFIKSETRGSRVATSARSLGLCDTQQVCLAPACWHLQCQAEICLQTHGEHAAANHSHIKFVDDTKCSGKTNTQEDRNKIQKHIDSPGYWAGNNRMHFSRDKCNVLHRGLGGWTKTQLQDGWCLAEEYYE